MLSIGIYTILGCMLCVLLRLGMKLGLYDKILLINFFGTNASILIVLIGLAANNDLFIDIALTYVCVNLAAIVGFRKFLTKRSADV